ncbi:MAG: hypothetical protein AAFR87_34915 [Bacteroidota bacterium]
MFQENLCDGFLDATENHSNGYYEDLSAITSLLRPGLEEAYRLLTEKLSKLSGIRFPSLPRDQRLTADWELLFRTWFFELKPIIEGASWSTIDRLIFDYDSPYCLDIKNSVSFQELKKDFCQQIKSIPQGTSSGTINARFSFTGPGTGRSNYYSLVEWYIGSYAAGIRWRRKNSRTYELDMTLKNKSGWRSGTRLPITWQNKIKEVTGVSIKNFVNDASRGQTVKRKLNPEIAKIFDRLSIPIPSFGGDFWQEYKLKAEWTCN